MIRRRETQEIAAGRFRVGIEPNRNVDVILEDDLEIRSVEVSDWLLTAVPRSPGHRNRKRDDVRFRAKHRRLPWGFLAAAACNGDAKQERQHVARSILARHFPDSPARRFITGC
jgi:hypothetical protein